MDFASKLLLALFGFAVGNIVERIRGWWRRRVELREIGEGKRFRSLDFLQIYVTEKDGKRRLHAVPLGTLPMEVFFHNKAATDHLVSAASGTTKHESVIPMPGPLGSYILRELFGLMHMVGPKALHPIDYWVMVPVFETYATTEFQTPTVLFVRESDLRYFVNFAECREMLVFAGSHGAHILTGIEVAKKFAEQAEGYSAARATGKSTRHKEGMWLTPLRLDTEFKESDPELVASGRLRGFRPVPWERYARDLEALGYESA